MFSRHAESAAFYLPLAAAREPATRPPHDFIGGRPHYISLRGKYTTSAV